MSFLTIFALIPCLAIVQAGWLHGPSSQILTGPSSRTTLVGPEGSVITASAPGGQIIHEENPGVLTHAAPIVAPVVPHVAPATVVAHSSVYNHDGVAIVGPSGSFSTYGHGVAPAVVLGRSIDDNGYEGQYVHDHSELLYDDGSYKPYAYHH